MDETKATETAKSESKSQMLVLEGMDSIIQDCSKEMLSKRIRESKLVFVDSACPIDLSLNKNIVVVPGGEGAKSPVVFDAILDCFFQQKLVRTDTVYAVGGGALCDTLAYVASVYMRGIKIVLVPSTLLAMVDASIGGKTAINYRTWKNMVGTFYPASEILICPHLLGRLSQDLLREGLAEIIKAGMLRDPSLLMLIEAQGKSLLATDFGTHMALWTTIIWKAIKVKVDIVQEDLKEKNIRAFLNLGHTFAHAHESCARKGSHGSKIISHGDAVGLGIRATLILGSMIKTRPSDSDQNFTNNSYAERIIRLLDSLEYPNNYNGYSSKMLLEAMTMDKKRAIDSHKFIVQSDCTKTEILKVDETTIVSVLQKLGAK